MVLFELPFVIPREKGKVSSRVTKIGGVQGPRGSHDGSELADLHARIPFQVTHRQRREAFIIAGRVSVHMSGAPTIYCN